jgi:hypothetical protein
LQSVFCLPESSSPMTLWLTGVRWACLAYVLAAFSITDYHLPDTLVPNPTTPFFLLIFLTL